MSATTDCAIRIQMFYDLLKITTHISSHRKKCTRYHVFRNVQLSLNPSPSSCIFLHRIDRGGMPHFHIHFYRHHPQLLFVAELFLRVRTITMLLEVRVITFLSLNDHTVSLPTTTTMPLNLTMTASSLRIWHWSQRFSKSNNDNDALEIWQRSTVLQNSFSTSDNDRHVLTPPRSDAGFHATERSGHLHPEVKTIPFSWEAK